MVTNRDSIQSLESYLIEVLKHEDIPEDNKKKMERFLRNFIRTMVFVSIGSLLNKIVVSIRKPELLEIVESSFPRKNTPAYDLLHILFLLETSDKLDSRSVKKIVEISRKFENSQNAVAKRLLSLSVQYYANTHKIHHRLRAKLFHALNIDSQHYPSKKRQIQKKN